MLEDKDYSIPPEDGTFGSRVFRTRVKCQSEVVGLEGGSLLLPFPQTCRCVCEGSVCGWCQVGPQDQDAGGVRPQDAD